MGMLLPGIRSRRRSMPQIARAELVAGEVRLYFDRRMDTLKTSAVVDVWTIASTVRAGRRYTGGTWVAGASWVTTYFSMKSYADLGLAPAGVVGETVKYVSGDLRAASRFEMLNGEVPARVVGDGSTLDLDFSSGVMPAGLTFTRSVTAYSQGPNGWLIASLSNVPRFAYRTGACLGILLEPQTINQVRYSNDLTGANWAATGATLSRSTNVPGVTDLFGKTQSGQQDLSRIVVNPTPASSHCAQQSITVSAGQTVLSAYVLLENNFAPGVCLTMPAAWFADATARRVFFNIETGTKGSQSGTILATNIEPLHLAGNGYRWYRISIGATTQAGTGLALVGVAKGSASGDDVYDGDTYPGSIFCNMIQVEGVSGSNSPDAALPTSPIVTAGSAGTRVRDAISLVGISALGWQNSGCVVVDFEPYPDTYSSAFMTQLGFFAGSDAIAARCWYTIVNNSSGANPRAWSNIYSTGGSSMFGAVGIGGTRSLGRTRIVSSWAYDGANTTLKTQLTGQTLQSSSAVAGSGKVPDRLLVNQDANSGNIYYLPTIIRSIRYWPASKSDSEIAALTVLN